MLPFLHRLQAPAPEENPLWLIVLADMMTNLMLFFLVMFALSQQSAKAREEAAKAFDAKDVVAVASAVDEKTAVDFKEHEAAAKLKELFADTTVNENMIRVRLQDQILFPSALSTLSPEASAPLAKLARVLNELPNPVVIEGHTDDIRLTKLQYHSNWELSVSRANSVIETLVADGIPPERLIAAGYGEFRPIGDNKTTEGRARNRRVEIIILRGEAAKHE